MPVRTRHVGFSEARLVPSQNNPREVTFADKWREENELWNILNKLVPNATERDEQVAATVIQWLGSNIGMAFLAEVAEANPKIGGWFTRAARPAWGAKQMNKKKMTPAECKAEIYACIHMDALKQRINDIAKEQIPDFHFLDFKVSTFWSCEQSPIGMCVFKLDSAWRPTYCRYCGGPVERK